MPMIKVSKWKSSFMLMYGRTPSHPRRIQQDQLLFKQLNNLEIDSITVAEPYFVEMLTKEYNMEVVVSVLYLWILRKRQISMKILEPILYIGRPCNQPGYIFNLAYRN